MRLFALVPAAALLSACSNEHLEALRLQQQADVDREVHALVHDGMKVFEAVPNLQRAGFSCSPHGDVPPSFECGRTRRLGGQLLVNCVEHVSFVDTLVDNGAIARLEVGRIACLGTP